MPGADDALRVRYLGWGAEAMFDVCKRCFARRRRFRFLLWTVLALLVVATAWWTATHH